MIMVAVHMLQTCVLRVFTRLSEGILLIQSTFDLSGIVSGWPRWYTNGWS